MVWPAIYGKIKDKISVEFVIFQECIGQAFSLLIQRNKLHLVYKTGMNFNYRQLKIESMQTRFSSAYFGFKSSYDHNMR